MAFPVPTQLEMRVRRGVVNDVEVAARVGVLAVEVNSGPTRAVLTLGGDVTGHFMTPAPGRGGVVGLVSLGVSTAAGNLDGIEPICRSFAYPTLVAGWESTDGAALFGGVRGMVALDEPDVLVGPIAGFRALLPSRCASRFVLGFEVAALQSVRNRRIIPAVQITVGRLPGR